MKLGDLGEDQLLDQLLPRFLLKNAVVVGPGDDCAVVETQDRRGDLLVLKTDCVVEEVHFLPAADAADEGVELIVVKHHEAKKGFVLLPRRWVVERTFGWLGRFRRLARDYERLPETLAAWHWVAFIALMLGRLGLQSA